MIQLNYHINKKKIHVVDQIDGKIIHGFENVQEINHVMNPNAKSTLLMYNTNVYVVWGNKNKDDATSIILAMYPVANTVITYNHD